MSIKKQFLKSKPVCKVTFEINADQINGAETVALLGDFNNWDPSANSLKKQKNGTFKTTLDLEAEKSYQFRYLVDGTTWINDEEADTFVAAGVANAENGVIQL
jgi:1,4-alpha-glucan branching enzyme